MTAAVAKSHKRDNGAENSGGQAPEGAKRANAAEFAARLEEALEGTSSAEISRITGIPKQTIFGFRKGAIPSADRALLLADATGVNLRWLISGEGPKRNVAETEDSDSVLLDRYDVFSFGEYGKGARVEQVSVPAAWLVAATRTTTGLWLTEMPSDALPDVAREGETIICRDPETPLQDRRVYIFLLDGRPIVRRIAFQPNQVVLRAEDEADTITLRPDELGDRLMPAGRILATVRLDQV